MASKRSYLRETETSSVRIVVKRKGNRGGHLGSGTIVWEDEGYFLILTCGHTFARSDDKFKSLAVSDISDISIEVKFHNGAKSKAFEVITGPKEMKKEVGLLFGYDPKLEGMNLNAFSLTAKAHPYEEIYCSSYPYGVSEPITVMGRICQDKVQDEDFKTLLLANDITVGNGSSGACIMNKRKHIIGVHLSSKPAPVFKISYKDDKVIKRIGDTSGLVTNAIGMDHVEEVVTKFYRRLVNSCDAECDFGTVFGYFKQKKEEEMEEKRKKEEEMEEMKKKDMEGKAEGKKKKKKRKRGNATDAQAQAHRQCIR